MNGNRGLLRILPLSDLLLIILVFMGGFWLRHSLLAGLFGDDFSLSASQYLLTGIVLGSIQVVLMAMFGVYRREFGLGIIDEYSGIIRASLMAVLLTFTTTFLSRQLLFSRFVLVFSCPASILLIGIWHMVIRRIVVRSGTPTPVLLIGTNRESKQLGAFLETRVRFPYTVKGYIEPDLTVEEITGMVDEMGIREVVVADRSLSEDTLYRIILHCERTGVDYKIVADMFSLVNLTARVSHLGGTTLIESVPSPLSGWSYILKKLADMVITVALLTILSPIFILTAIAIMLDSGFPIFYRQTRLGRDNKPFAMMKFRSMRKNAHLQKKNLQESNESSGPLFKIRDDPRITKVGKFIRRWSIDELPQLFNVLAGRMSLVGPRPPLPEEVEEYSRRDFKRLHTLPGVTGVWQISGRSNLSFDEMIKLDLYYVDNWSIWMDLAILLLTPAAVFSREGAY